MSITSSICVKGLFLEDPGTSQNILDHFKTQEKWKSVVKELPYTLKYLSTLKFAQFQYKTQ